MYELERTLHRLQQRVTTLPGLTAAFLVGSMGRRSEDRFSDLDVVLVYRAGSIKEAARSGWPTLAAELLPYVQAIVLPNGENSDHIHALFANGAKFDLYFAAQEEVIPHPRYRKIRILHDTAGWAQELSSRSAAVALVERPAMSETALEELDRRFWIGYWDVYRLTRRGEVDRPFAIFIRLLADAILPLTAVLPAEHLAAQALVAAEFSRQADHNMRALRRLLNDYLSARAAVAEAHQLNFEPNDAVERELTRIIMS